MTEHRGCVVGAGFFARNHLHAWRGLDGVRIEGVCDVDAGRAEAGAAIAGARSFTDMQTMLGELRPDFVDIVTPPKTHRELVELAAGLGCHVICQKPLAPDPADARAMVDACDKAGVRFMVHENFRFQTPMRAVRRVIDEGRIGNPSYARIQHRHHHDIFATQPRLRTEKRLAVMDVGVHLLDLARFFMGEVEDLHARMRSVGPGLAGEDSVVLSLGHAGEAATLIDISFASWRQPDPFPQTLVRIEGDRGTLELREDFHMRVSSGAGGEDFHVPPTIPAWGSAERAVVEESVVAIQRHWLECLNAGCEPETPGSDNLRVLELAVSAYRDAGR